MAHDCFAGFSALAHALKDAGLLQAFRLEYDILKPIVPLTDCQKLFGAISNLIRTLQGYKDSLETAQGQVTPVDCSKVVQIQVGRSVINERINAFITRKRKEVDEWNVQEFCSSKPAEEESSCARVDAVLVSRSGGSSHVKVSRVVNQWGPMTKLLRPKPSDTPSHAKRRAVSPPVEGIHERLRNMESHLKIKSGCSVPQDVYARIKQLEDRILYLEGISPDYFTGPCAGQQESKRSRGMLKQYEDWSMSQIESRIHALQNRLREQNEQEAGT
ncbi:MAP3K12-binding inhibitory protein 1-like [Ornithodoros turicata]|uniref:MAP3K12-binding inhibitory protein 1-like n=1 Tax=Ornithodoros turicata TaxID=34597 RepID=UPI0031386B95